jgi:hypothetical protein
MTHAKLAKIGLLIAVAISLMPAAAAHALSKDNPQWETEGHLLGASETLLTTTKAEGTQDITIGSNDVSCKLVNYLEKKEGKEVERNIRGSEAPNAGTGLQTLEYGECEVPGHSGCTIDGGTAGHALILTEPLKETLVFSSKAAAEKEESLTDSLYEPKGKVFANVDFGGSCPTPGDQVLEEGATLSENVKGNESSKSHLLDSPSTLILTYYRNTSGKTEEVKIKAPATKVESGVTDWVVTGARVIAVLAIAGIVLLLIFN